MPTVHSGLLQKPFASCLPLWPTVVFVDWHGVLCHDVFWFRILSNPGHDLYKTIRTATDKLFSEEPDMVRSWMRGHRSTDDIINALGLRVDKRRRDDYWYRRLLGDCRRMKAHPALLSALQEVRRSSFVVLSTDNMDCFLSQVEAIDGVAETFDAVLCSSMLGVLKSDGVESFFGPWLGVHRIAFKDALLLDDTASICEDFRKAGGTAVTVRDTLSAIEAMNKWRVRRQES